MPAFVVVTVGVGVGLPLVQGLIMTAAPPEKAGSASAMSETSGELGIALGVATLGSVGAAVYRSQLVLPAEAPAQVAETAREGIAGAVVAAQQLPAGLGEQVLDSARVAFTTGLNVAATVSIVIFVALAILAARVLRDIRPIGEVQADQPEQAGSPPTPVAANA